MARQFDPMDYAINFDFIAGWLCLDFTNTVNYVTVNPMERIVTFEDLIGWGCIAGVISDGRAAELAAEAEQRQQDAGIALEIAHGLRYAIYEIFSAGFDGVAPKPIVIKAFNTAMSMTAPYLQIRHTPKRYDFEWTAERTDFNQIILPVIWSAVALLSSKYLGMVKRCAGAGCSQLFLDETRNHSRRWCSMARCGNRAKASRFYTRTRA